MCCCPRSNLLSELVRGKSIALYLSQADKIAERGARLQLEACSRGGSFRRGRRSAESALVEEKLGWRAVTLSTPSHESTPPRNPRLHLSDQALPVEVKIATPLVDFPRVYVSRRRPNPNITCFRLLVVADCLSHADLLTSFTTRTGVSEGSAIPLTRTRL